MEETIKLMSDDPSVATLRFQPYRSTVQRGLTPFSRQEN